MSEEEMMSRFLCDLTFLRLPVEDVDIVFRPYSKTYYGRYYPSVNHRTPKIAIYPYEADGNFMGYSFILETGVHEFIHHLQYSSGSFVRRKGIMHDPQFWKLYNQYMNRAYKLGIVEKEGVDCAAI